GVYVPGAVIALAVGAGSYALTGSYPQVRAWQQATAQTPGLLARDGAGLYAMVIFSQRRLPVNLGDDCAAAGSVALSGATVEKRHFG
ncbi:hypothetical protein ONJ95_24955, partial [Salmonella enterica subsp. enterica serovar Virginia]|nr:hypothetical protein [Salmonella enterica subsp. enterica serovar Virginia]